MLLQALSHSHGYAVSDGSYKDEMGAAAWIIKGSTLALRLVGQIYTPGHSMDHSSFCSELTGILGVLYTLTFWPPTLNKPTFQLACDGLSIINRLSNIKPINPTEPHADLLTAARNLISTSLYAVQLVFVRGHQDNSIPTVLTRDAWLNIKADRLAKQKLTTPYTGPVFYSLPGNPWSCYVGNDRVVKQFQPQLRKFINGQDTLQYWEKWKQRSSVLLQQVDWVSFGKAMREVLVSKRWWVSKWTSNHFAHGNNMVRWRQRKSGACPRCGQAEEDKLHVILCPQQEAQPIGCPQFCHSKNGCMSRIRTRKSPKHLSQV